MIYHSTAGIVSNCHGSGENLNNENSFVGV